jgi:hypothetical protein
MSKGNKYPQQNRTQPTQAEVAPLRAEPSSLSATEERIRDLEDLVAALVVRSGVGLARCRCGAFATRTITMDHPIAGIHSNACCDECEHPQTIAKDKTATTTAFEVPKVRTARRLNSVLQRAFARAEETVAEAAE